MADNETSNTSCFSEDLEELNEFALGISILGIVGVVLLSAVLGAVFFVNRNKSNVLKERANFILFLNIIGINVQAAWPIDSLRQRQGSPCIFYMNLRTFIVALMIVPVLFSSIRIFSKFKLNQKLAQRGLASAESWQRKKSVVSSPISNDLASSPQDNSLLPPTLLVWFSSTRNLGILLFLITVATVLASFYANYSFIDCFSPCATNSGNVEFIYLSVAGGVTTLGLTYFMCAVRKEPDPLGFRSQMYLLAFVTAVLAIPVTVLTSVDPKGLSVRGKVRWGDVWVLVCCVYLLVLLGYPLFLARQQFRKRSKVSFDEKLSLEAVLSFETGRRAFKAFLVNELNVEHFLFWNDVTLYKQKFATRGKGANVIMRKKIIDNFINQSSSLQVNISALLRTKVRQNLENDPTEEDFDEALKAVMELLEFDAFRRFTHTSLYKGLSWDEAL